MSNQSKNVGMLKSIYYYLQGNLRFKFYRLLPLHIKEQFSTRLLFLAKEQCVKQGECVVCECKTPELFLADKACSGYCYPKMENKKKWKETKKELQKIWKLFTLKSRKEVLEQLKKERK